MIYQYLDSSFKNYKNEEQYFTVCIASCVSVDRIKKVSIGISVCHSDDKFDKEKGRQIARERALSDNCEITMKLSHPGLMNKAIANVILNSIAGYIKQNPEFAIPGYNDRKFRYQKRISISKEIGSASNNVRLIYSMLKNMDKKEKKLIIKLCNYE